MSKKEMCLPSSPLNPIHNKRTELGIHPYYDNSNFSIERSDVVPNMFIHIRRKSVAYDSETKHGNH